MKYKRKHSSKKYKIKSRVYIIAVLLLIVIAAIAVFSCGNKSNEADKTVEQQVQVEEKPVKEYKFPKAEEENDLLKIATSIKDPNAKVCYLTFDDGPTEEVTPKVLEVLDEYGVKATFFALGKMIESNREIAERVVEEGHLLANHTYYHEYSKLYSSGENFIAEVEKAQGLIDEVTGEESFKLMRFPGGSHNAGPYGAVKQNYKELLKERGFYFADWNCLNGDAEASLRTPEQLLARTKETAIGKNLVVLMHDAAAKTTTPEALGDIIEYLRDNGYEFRRLDEIDYYSGAEDTENLNTDSEDETNNDDNTSESKKNTASEMIL